MSSSLEGQPRKKGLFIGEARRSGKMHRGVKSEVSLIVPAPQIFLTI
jgi:hypothetical protein